MSKALIGIFLFIACLPAQLRSSQPGYTDGAVARAVLFYSPACGHCHYVITETLSPMAEQYGGQLQIYGIDITTREGQALFHSTIEYFNLEGAGVPFLVIGNQYLIGSRNIPERFPALVAYHLARGGVDWPKIPGLAEMLPPQVPAPPTATVQPGPEPSAALPLTTQTQTASPAPLAQDMPTPVPVASPVPAAEPIPTAGPVLVPTLSPLAWDDSTLTVQERLALDPAGNTLAILVLLGMLVAVGFSGLNFHRLSGRALGGFQAWLVLALCLIGLGVAAYLAFVETTHTEAVCGPVGDCNTVQQSEYARLFGILPIGVLGVAGYIAIIIAWFINQYSRGRLADYAALAMLGMTAFGTLFSIYLTFLEPFVIGATCAWCLTSAMIMTLLLLLSLRSGRLAFSRLIQSQKRKK